MGRRDAPPVELARAWLDDPGHKLVAEDRTGDERRRAGEPLAARATPEDLVLWANGKAAWEGEQLGVLGRALEAFSEWSDPDGFNDPAVGARVLEVVDGAFADGREAGAEAPPVAVERARVKRWAGFFWEAIEQLGLAGNADGGIDVHVSDGSARALWHEALSGRDLPSVTRLARSVAEQLEEGDPHEVLAGTTDFYGELGPGLVDGMRVAAVVDGWDESGPFGRSEMDACGDIEGLAWFFGNEGDLLRRVAHYMHQGVRDALWLVSGPPDFWKPETRERLGCGDGSEYERKLGALLNVDGFLADVLAEDGCVAAPANGPGR